MNEQKSSVHTDKEIWKPEIIQDLIEESWKAGDLTYLLRPHQLEMYQLMADFILRPQKGNLKFIANCSRRFGKTFVSFLIAMQTAFQKTRAIVRFVAPSRVQLKEIVLPMFRMMMQDCPAYMRPSFKAADNAIVIREGMTTESRIILSGCDDSESVERIRGTSADLAVITEAGSIPMLQYIIKDIIIPQLLTTGGKMIIDSTPPRDAGHYFNITCDEGIMQGNYCEFTIDKNTSLDEETRQAFIDELGGPESTSTLRELYCQRIADEERAIIPEWHGRSTDVVRPENFDALHKYVSLDIGGARDRTLMLFGYYDYNRATLVVESEIGLSPYETTTENIAAAYKDMVAKQGYLSVHRQPADSNNQILLRDLSTVYGISFFPTSKDTLQAMVNKVRAWVPRIEVSVHCPELLGCLKSGSWNATREKWSTHTIYGHYDALAALMYMVRNIDEVSMPKIKGFTRDNFFDPIEDEPNQGLLRMVNR